jgi:hypothetical protein
LDRSLTGSQVALLPVQHDLHYSFCADSFAPPRYHRFFPSIVLLPLMAMPGFSLKLYVFRGEHSMHGHTCQFVSGMAIIIMRCAQAAFFRF